MKHRRISLRIGAIGLLTATSVLAAPATQAMAPATCQGEPATLVGTPDIRQLNGTSGPDVVVTGGARNVDTRAGDDLVCVTGKTETVMAGDGDDRVFTGDLPVPTSTDLEAGNDKFVGGTRNDRVSPGPGIDQVDTGDGADTYIGYKLSAANSDHVNLGLGPDSASVVDSNLDGVLDGGSGFNTLALGTCCEDEHAWVVDSGTETASLDGNPRFQWDNFRGFGFNAFAVEGTLEFHGTDAAEEVAVVREFAAPTIKVLDMRGGDDQVNLLGTVGPVLAGDGNDSVRLDGFADERSPSSLESAISLDLGAGTLRRPTRGQTFDFIGVENVDVSDFVTVDVRGDEQANNLVVGRACLSRIDGLGGPDSIRARSDQGCSKRYTLQHSLRADGGAGYDLLLGRQTRDQLIGGPGVDSADGRGEVDTCEAEIQQRCER